MGRTKGTPRARSSDHDVVDRDAEVMGRVVAEVTVEQMFAEELKDFPPPRVKTIPFSSSGRATAGHMLEERLQQKYVNPHSSRERNDQSAKRKRPAKRRQTLVDSSDEEGAEDQVGYFEKGERNADSSNAAVTAIVDSSDDEEASSSRKGRDKDTLNLEGKRPAKLPRSSKRGKRLHFVEEHASSNRSLSEPIEVQIENDNIQIRFLKEELRKDNRSIALKSWLVPRHVMLEEKARKFGYTNISDYSVQVYTKQGSYSLLSVIPKWHEHNTISDFKVIAEAIHDGSLIMELCEKKVTTSTVKETQLGVHLSVNVDRAIEVGNPAKFPVGTRKKLPGASLQKALAQLLPNDKPISSMLKVGKSNDKTAKQVYALVDNVQYHSNQNLDGKPLRAIPGLVPTLRPYQEAAVKWMLRREQAMHGKGDSNEWELAWFMWKEDQGQFVSLLQCENGRKGHGAIFYCPVMGWWAQSWDQARSYCVSNDDKISRGGILAESMGLGKTVEVLACILANPAPEILTSNSHRASSKGPMFSEQDSMDANDQYDNETLNIVTPEKVQLRTQQGPEGISSTDSENSSLVAGSSIEETWIETHELVAGICICGKPVEYSQAEKMPFVVCRKCKEPMHAICADVVDYENTGRPLVCRRLFSNDRFEYRECPPARCPCCVASQCDSDGLLSSRATIIVTPAAILRQWEREIQRHTSSTIGRAVEFDRQKEQLASQPLKVVVYPGIRELCNQKSTQSIKDGNPSLLHPRILADADIVLMTFEALMSDLGHSDDNPFVDGTSNGPQRSLRHRKLYRVVPSPLLSIRWWRVCLDEAQRVETPTAASARMALKLEASNRWCISGTPIGRGKLDDLYGLILFLRLQPFSTKAWFTKCLLQSDGELVNSIIQRLLQNVFWRSTKASRLVQEQMGIPEQVEKRTLLKFCSIERHFYQRQLETTLNIAGDVTKSRRYRKSQLDDLSLQLHKLRAACCHPQVGSSGLGRTNKKRDAVQKLGEKGQYESSEGFSRVLTMDQILDRLIDDAKLKCEEAQRLALMHNNAMAALLKLKVEAKKRGVTIEESDRNLLTQSCKLYLDSLKMTEENSEPGLVVGEAMLTGSQGFRKPRKVIRKGSGVLDWQTEEFDEHATSKNIREMWSRVDFEGPAKKITQIRVRPISDLPMDLEEQDKADIYTWKPLIPKECVFQVASAAVGGEFVDVAHFELGGDCDWVRKGNFRTNRSKSWRLVIKSYHDSEEGAAKNHTGMQRKLYCGVEIELFEADIAGDSLQRLHVLHNACLSFESLIDIGKHCNDDHSETFLPAQEMESMLTKMQDEIKLIEALYIDGVLPLHRESQRQLELAMQERQRNEEKLFSLHPGNRAGSLTDIWEDGWWNDILIMLNRYGTEQEKFELCKRVQEDLSIAMEGAYDRTALKGNPFPAFDDVNGLYQGLSLRQSDLRSNIPPGSVSKCLERFREFPMQPDQADIQESAKCQRCKQDWNWNGPMCSHCKLSVELNKLIPDRLFLIVLTSIHNWMKGGKASSSLASARMSAKMDERASTFFKALDAARKEKSAAERAWRIHLDLLNDHDELNMCKRAIRLALEGEDLSVLANAELNAIVHPIDVCSAYMDHGAKQAMGLGNLRRHKSTLRYLKNQNDELPSAEKEGDKREKEGSCIVCLSSFQNGRAVLACGHSFHYSPCLEKLMARQGNQQYISCPLRCAARTKREDVMMATEKRRDDGSLFNYEIKGSWGTKVTQLVADVLNVATTGEKSVVFSMWEDMLRVVQEALRVNDIPCVRAQSVAKLSESIRRFRSSDCSVLLLNVKNGAEGLTLVEATHVFMVEPLLNCGLDSQAINRIHRIGQTCKTYVHRYLIEDTIEIKIDKLRMERQEDQIEDSVNELKKTAFNAGGIDGGFQSQKELMDVLQFNN